MIAGNTNSKRPKISKCFRLKGFDIFSDSSFFKFWEIYIYINKYIADMLIVATEKRFLGSKDMLDLCVKIFAKK